MSDVIWGIKGFRADLEQPWAFDAWESEQESTIYAKMLQHKAEKENKSDRVTVCITYEKDCKNSKKFNIFMNIWKE